MTNIYQMRNSYSNCHQVHMIVQHVLRSYSAAGSGKSK